MRTIASPEEMQATCRELRLRGRRLGLVPTMGALHEGHLSLVRMARAQTELVAVSLFVNPLQFGPTEDYSQYPRPLDHDRQMLEAEQVDLLFTPATKDMYSADASTYVMVEGMSDKLCGRSRPGHFRGVTTAVTKLFHITQPDIAYFGQKDAAQAAILRQMVRDLNFSLDIVIGPTIREADGLALSSRNAYLDPQQRESATALYRALKRIQTMANQGERRTEALVKEGAGVLAEEPSVRVEYLELVNPDTLAPVPDISQGALVAVAAHLGSARLIDNILLGGGAAAEPKSANRGMKGED